MPKHAKDRAIDTVSLRDYFAVAAMRIVLDGHMVDDVDHWFEPEPLSEMAGVCYQVADAMVKARAESDDDAG